MPANRNALIRYKTIDQCLQNRFRKWTIDDLVDACSDALYEYEGIDKGVSKRTVQGDIQTMRSDKLGYNAPIIVLERKYYTYEDEEYSITNIPISNQDLDKLTEAVEFMKQFQGFSHFQDLNSMVQKLEDQIYAAKTQKKPVIDFEKNENLRGLKFLDVLYKAIIQKQSLDITYKSFKARNEETFTIYPYLLKEFRNRWFILGQRKKREGVLNLALDRILSISKSELPFQEANNFDPETHFKDVIGVTVSPSLPAEKVVLYVVRKHAPYVLTKPLHSSQKMIDQDRFGITISLNVQHNFELEKEILAFGEAIHVIKPYRLRKNIKNRLLNAVESYHGNHNDKTYRTATKQLEHKGFSVLEKVYTTNELRRIIGVLEKEGITKNEKVYAQRKLLQKVPTLKGILFNRNLRNLLERIDERAVLTKAIYFDKSEKFNWVVPWHQDAMINVKFKKETDGYYGWTKKGEVISVCPPEQILQNTFTVRIHLDDVDDSNGVLKVIPGSHKTRLEDAEVKAITQNSIPHHCNVDAGGVHLMKPLILHSSLKSETKKRRRVIHLEFCSEFLPNNLVWEELFVY
ncbi:WYL domain-containing protein [Aureivirga sp. CE67]|uniref:WYL domain-containing protein n=1 Tax=Aureivirga sp. CE67 TaxID=1788983 RepID=UPI0018C9A113|nr:WYL domain-containing protein [Aureivirga sp. CE67]